MTFCVLVLQSVHVFFSFENEDKKLWGLSRYLDSLEAKTIIIIFKYNYFQVFCNEEYDSFIQHEKFYLAAATVFQVKITLSCIRDLT